MKNTIINTERLVLRRWSPNDLDALIAMNADPEVMTHFVKVMTAEESTSMHERFLQHWEKYGFGPYAVEIPGETTCAGFVGVFIPRFETWFTPCAEFAWRLATKFHGKGYATEAAKAILPVSFTQHHYDKIYAFSVPANKSSQRVMEKLGMEQIGDFDHPNVPEGHELKRHLLYAISK